jgi:hypothetical protein
MMQRTPGYGLLKVNSKKSNHLIDTQHQSVWPFLSPELRHEDFDATLQFLGIRAQINRFPLDGQTASQSCRALLFYGPQGLRHKGYPVLQSMDGWSWKHHVIITSSHL